MVIVVFICIFEIVLCLEFPNCVTAALLEWGTNFPISYSPQPPDVPTHLLPVPSSAQQYSFLLLGHISHLFQPFCACFCSCLFDFDCFCDAGSLCVQWLSKCCLYLPVLPVSQRTCWLTDPVDRSGQQVPAHTHLTDQGWKRRETVNDALHLFTPLFVFSLFVKVKTSEIAWKGTKCAEKFIN